MNQERQSSQGPGIESAMMQAGRFSSEHLGMHFTFLPVGNAVGVRALVHTLWDAAGRLDFAFDRSFLPILVGHFVKS